MAEKFYLSNELLDAVDGDDVRATYNDMVELDIARGPFPEYQIVTNYARLVKVRGKEYTHEEMQDISRWSLVSEYKNDELVECWIVWPETPHRRVALSKMLKDVELQDPESVSESMEQMDVVTGALSQILIVALATRNHVARRTKNQGILNRHGIPHGRKEYVTMIFPPETGDSDGDGTGTVRPHLRRGHIRRQRYGPQLQFERKRWIEPVFVNAHPGAVSERRRYNMGAQSVAGPDAMSSDGTVVDYKTT